MAIHNIQVTLGASATQVTTVNTFARWVTVQNNAAAAMRVGDSTASSTKGINLAATGGIYTFVPQSTPSSGYDLSTFYIAGTATQVADVLYED